MTLFTLLVDNFIIVSDTPSLIGKISTPNLFVESNSSEDRFIKKWSFFSVFTVYLELR